MRIEKKAGVNASLCTASLWAIILKEKQKQTTETLTRLIIVRKTCDFVQTRKIDKIAGGIETINRGIWAYSGTNKGKNGWREYTAIKNHIILVCLVA